MKAAYLKSTNNTIQNQTSGPPNINTVKQYETFGWVSLFISLFSHEIYYYYYYYYYYLVCLGI